MNDELIARRGWLRGAGLAGGLAVAGVALSAGPAAADDDDDDHDDHDDVRGSWLVEVVDDAGERTRSVLSFAAGDVAIVHDISPAGPPWTGTWDDQRRNGFRATVWTGFPGETGPGSAGATARVRLTGSADRNQISGTFQATIFDPTGAEVAAFGGTFAGPRIEA